jgi:hypothetical protein
MGEVAAHFDGALAIAKQFGMLAAQNGEVPQMTLFAPGLPAVAALKNFVIPGIHDAVESFHDIASDCIATIAEGCSAAMVFSVAACQALHCEALELEVSSLV